MLEIWPYIIAVLGGIATIVAAYLRGSKAGADKERVKSAKRDAAAKEEQLEMFREASEIERKAKDLTDEEAEKEALTWSRKR